MKATVSSVTIAGPEAALAAIGAAEIDLRAAGRIDGDLTYEPADQVEVRDAQLVPPPPKN